jgi:hypothetical protein
MSDFRPTTVTVSCETPKARYTFRGRHARHQELRAALEASQGRLLGMLSDEVSKTLGFHRQLEAMPLGWVNALQLVFAMRAVEDDERIRSADAKLGWEGMREHWPSLQKHVIITLGVRCGSVELRDVPAIPEVFDPAAPLDMNATVPVRFQPPQDWRLAVRLSVELARQLGARLRFTGSEISTEESLARLAMGVLWREMDAGASA